jgi:hypothetical protein
MSETINIFGYQIKAPKEGETLTIRPHQKTLVIWELKSDEIEMSNYVNALAYGVTQKQFIDEFNKQVEKFNKQLIKTQ